MAQRACAVDHSSGACAIEGAQAVIAQISAQMELSYNRGPKFRLVFVMTAICDEKWHAATV